MWLDLCGGLALEGRFLEGRGRGCSLSRGVSFWRFDSWGCERVMRECNFRIVNDFTGGDLSYIFVI